MDIDLNHPAFPSFTSLLYDFDDEVFSSSEGSTPADSPTFYKYGESSRLPEMKPMFHSSTTDDSYKAWHLCGKESYPSYPPCQDSYQDMQLWEDVGEMEIDSIYYGSSSRQDTATRWPTRDNIASCSSAARFSLHLPHESSFGTDWCGSPPEDDLFNPASPLSSATSFHSGDSHLPESYLYRSPESSSQPVPIVSPVIIASSISPPQSPASASSYSSVSPSSFSCPPPPTPVLLPELHQPRPGRPIPIIPLSKLATACEEFYMPSPKSSSGFPEPRHPFGDPKSSDLLAPVFINSGTHPSFPPEQILHDTLPLQHGHNGDPESSLPYFNSWSGHS